MIFVFTNIHTISPFVGHRDAVTCVRFSPDGRTILSGGGDNDCTLKLWSTDVREEERRVNPSYCTLIHPLLPYMHLRTPAIHVYTPYIHLTRL